MSPRDQADERRDWAIWVRSEGALWRVVLNDVVLAAAGSDKEPMALSGGAALWETLETPTSWPELGREFSDASGPSESGGVEGLHHLLLELSRLELVRRVD